jgi:hypothetical protein
MPRYAMVDKTVQGVRVSHTQFLNEVVKAVARVEGGARVADLIETLGQEWDPQEQRKFLATTLDNMTRRHVTSPGMASGGSTRSPLTITAPASACSTPRRRRSLT